MMIVPKFNFLHYPTIRRKEWKEFQRRGKRKETKGFREEMEDERKHEVEKK